ncbi:MAG: DUF560 domain-containing protein [Inquilinus sp.]|nr:DUF560 domain-containing protein [Inquilinus sp.]
MISRFLNVLALLVACLVLGPPAIAQETAAPEGGPEPTRIQIDLIQVLEQARAAVRAGDFEKAVGLYQVILRFAPESRVARIEMSLALARLGDRERAARLVRDIDTEGLRPEVIDIISRLVGPDRLTFFLIPEFFVDTNVIGQTKNDFFTVDGAIIPTDSNARGRRGFGYGLTFGGSYRLTDENPRTTLTLGTTLRDFEASKDDEQNLFGSVGWLFDFGRLDLTPSLAGAYRYRDWRPREAEWSAGIAAAVAFEPVRNTLGFRYRQIDGEGDFDGVLNRTSYEIYDTIGFGFDGVAFRIDARHIREVWEQREEQDNYEAIGGIDTTFVDVPWAIPTVGVSYTYRDFENPEPLFNILRTDREYEGHLELLFRDWELFGTRPFVRYEYTKSESTYNLFDYDKHEISVGVRAITW